MGVLGVVALFGRGAGKADLLGLPSLTDHTSRDAISGSQRSRLEEAALFSSVSAYGTSHLARIWSIDHYALRYVSVLSRNPEQVSLADIFAQEIPGSPRWDRAAIKSSFGRLRLALKEAFQPRLVYPKRRFRHGYNYFAAEKHGMGIGQTAAAHHAAELRDIQNNKTIAVVTKVLSRGEDTR